MIIKHKAFTLAEILIILAIIGVVAAITIPSMMQSTQKQEYVSALKKEYSTLSQAYNLMLADNGGDIAQLVSSTNDDVKFLEEIAPKLKIAKNCGSNTGCFYTTARKFFDGSINHSNLDAAWNGNYGKAILADGSLIVVDITSSTCSSTPGTTQLKVCGDIGIDINGIKGPNTVGRDHFAFWIARTGIYPKGIDNDGLTCDTTGFGCTAKVLTEGAMNY